MKKASAKKVPTSRPIIYLLFNTNELGNSSDIVREMDYAFLGSYATKQEAVRAWANHIVEIDNDLESKYFSKNGKLIKTEKDLESEGWKILWTEVPEGASVTKTKSTSKKTPAKTKVAKSESIADKIVENIHTLVQDAVGDVGRANELLEEIKDEVREIEGTKKTSKISKAKKSKTGKSKTSEKDKIVKNVLVHFRRAMESRLNKAELEAFWSKHQKEIERRALEMYEMYAKGGQLDDIRGDKLFTDYEEFLLEDKAIKAALSGYEKPPKSKKAKAKRVDISPSDRFEFDKEVELADNFDSPKENDNPDSWPIYSITFPITRYEEFSHTLKFKKGVSEKKAIDAVEEYLSQPMTEAYWNKIKSDLDGYMKEEEVAEGTNRGRAVGDAILTRLITLSERDNVPKSRQSTKGKRHVIISYEY